jgi:hypothetical protein
MIGVNLDSDKSNRITNNSSTVKYAISYRMLLFLSQSVKVELELRLAFEATYTRLYTQIRRC